MHHRARILAIFSARSLSPSGVWHGRVSAEERLCWAKVCGNVIEDIVCKYLAIVSGRG
jgi:hypothetical protein